jgi:Tfp pilus assembly protein PilO
MLTIEQIRKIAVVSFVILGILAGVVIFKINQSLYDVRQELSARRIQKRQLIADISRVKISIDQYQKEIDQVQPYLFKERDVPAFLDNISEFAKKSSVTVIDMTTQRFQEVILPKDETASAASEQRRRKFGNDTLDKKSREEEEQDVITFAAMPIQIKISGTFESLVDFLFALDGYKQLITLGNVEIGVGNNYPVLECNFLLKIYSLKTLRELESI